MSMNEDEKLFWIGHFVSKALGVLKLLPKPGFFSRGAFFSDVDRDVRPIGMSARMLLLHLNMKPECEVEIVN